MNEAIIILCTYINIKVHKTVNNPSPPEDGTFNYILKNSRKYDIPSHSVVKSRETHFTAGT
jgi:hypothetical protein